MVDETPGVEHPHGGIGADAVAAEVFVPPESGRLDVDTLAPAEGGEACSLVKLTIHTPAISGKILLDADQARALADRLQTAAADADPPAESGERAVPDE